MLRRASAFITGSNSDLDNARASHEKQLKSEQLKAEKLRKLEERRAKITREAHSFAPPPPVKEVPTSFAAYAVNDSRPSAERAQSYINALQHSPTWASPATTHSPGFQEQGHLNVSQSKPETKRSVSEFVYRGEKGQRQVNPLKEKKLRKDAAEHARLEEIARLARVNTSEARKLSVQQPEFVRQLSSIASAISPTKEMSETAFQGDKTTRTRHALSRTETGETSYSGRSGSNLLRRPTNRSYASSSSVATTPGSGVRLALQQSGKSYDDSISAYTHSVYSPYFANQDFPTPKSEMTHFAQVEHTDMQPSPSVGYIDSTDTDDAMSPRVCTVSVFDPAQDQANLNDTLASDTQLRTPQKNTVQTFNEMCLYDLALKP